MQLMFARKGDGMSLTPATEFEAITVSKIEENNLQTQRNLQSTASINKIRIIITVVPRIEGVGLRDVSLQSANRATKAL
jgi:hypothetical protein